MFSRNRLFFTVPQLLVCLSVRAILGFSIFSLKKKISLLTASAIVVANMIGTGVFTSLGFQLSSVQNTWSILLLWGLGGILALFGAFAYAELGTHYKESGGDYIYLSRTFHPLLGYLSAWAGLTVGFSAPVALAAMAFTSYLAPGSTVDNPVFGAAVILLIGLTHSFTLRHSARLQNLSTLVKILFILCLIVVGFLLPTSGANAIQFSGTWSSEILTPGFAVSMVYVAFAYTGWNAAAYVVDEINEPEKNLPRALILSTLFVAVIYVLFQFVLLRSATTEQLSGKEEVTYIAFNNLLGSTGGKWVSIFIAIQLLATISSYLWVGPRVTAALAREYKIWQPLAVNNIHGIPVKALWAHVILSILLLMTGSFERVLLYAGFVLQLMSSLTVAASLFIKRAGPTTFRTPLKPVFQLIFLAFNAWVLIFTMIDRPVESLVGLGIILAGALLYRVDTRTAGAPN